MAEAPHAERLDVELVDLVYGDIVLHVNSSGFDEFFSSVLGGREGLEGLSDLFFSDIDVTMP